MPATSEGTKTYAKDHPTTGGYSDLGRTGLRASRIGFGGYRIDDFNPAHRDALTLALTSGFNLVDTSTNYTDGRSEKIIGKVVEELAGQGKVRRDGVVLVSKVGYVQGENLRLAAQREAAGQEFSEMTKVSPSCWHCISPEFIQDQISRSLERLRTDCIDILLLHNPEYFLKMRPDPTEYYRRIQSAFRKLEEEVERGRIQYYGISSNTFPVPSDDPEFTSLLRVLECARKVSDRHHFAAVQFPFNLFEAGACTEGNNDKRSVLEIAREHQLATLANRPLNAFTGRSMVRLASFPIHGDLQELEEAVHREIAEACRIETEYPGGKLDVEPLALGHLLQGQFAQVADIVTWRDFVSYQAGPALRQSILELRKHSSLSSWTEHYQKIEVALLAIVTEFLETKAGMNLEDLDRRLIENFPALKTRASLSQKVLSLYSSVPGLNCVLLGMREPRYVQDALGVAPLLEADGIFNFLQGLQGSS